MHAHMTGGSDSLVDSGIALADLVAEAAVEEVAAGWLGMSGSVQQY